MIPEFIHKVLGQFSSRFGSIYKGANDSRFRTKSAFNRNRPGIEDILLPAHDRQRLRLECRDLWRNNEIVRGVTDRFIDYTVFRGIKPQAQTKDTVWNEVAESWWNDIYTPMADSLGVPEITLITRQKHAVGHRMLDGELFFVLMANGQIQALEADLICTPKSQSTNKNVIQGIVRGPNGRLRGYFVCPRMNGGSADTKKSRFIPKKNMIHCWNPGSGRVDQWRGIPDLAPALDKIRDYDETDEAIINKIKADARQQFLRSNKGGLANEGRRRGGTQLKQTDDKNPEKVEKTEWGTIHNLVDGQTMTAFDSPTPNSRVVQYLQHELRAIAASLNISYEIVMLIFTEGNFSAQRAALIHNQHTFLAWHQWVIDTFLQRLWNWRIAKAMKNGELPLAPLVDGVSQWFRVEWSLPFFDWVDPNRQALADASRYDMGLVSIKGLARQRGRDRNELFNEKAGDIIAAHNAAQKINDATKLSLGWEDIIRTNLISQRETREPGDVTNAT